ncbi:MAG TPA: nitrate/sulfonate/bicarbonate ABC transporter ATP-binding protein [Steroidobacteraceae bacterium]|nr:nitrate/sulfonate/bicarbonate ABC transporter ATP-binding protein [Steroidobacteraceae bacterium]
MDLRPSDPVLELCAVSMAFPKPSGEPLPVLAQVNISMREGEILGLLGRSGSGKSTLLRIAAGLIKPSAGEVRYHGAPLAGPSKGIAVVFQTFALFPWLTVLENVEAGLDALALPRPESRRRALAAIDLIGLDGFQSAYPRELSGGMRQRVGFARAIVTEPTALLMDEPFSALDVLTAETLRTDFLDLWTGQQLSTRAALLVTHNIEEAVLMCDRIVVLASNPAHIAAEVPVSLARPRDRLEEAFRGIVDQIYSILTSRSLESIGAQRQLRGGAALPRVSVNQISGLIEKFAAAPYDGHAELATVATQLALQSDELFPTAEALHMLAFAEIKQNALRLTAAGRIYAQSDTEARKRLFREHLLQFVPLAAHIHRVLEEREDHQAPRLRFETELEDHLTRQDAERTLRVVTGWGRYAELFSYDDRTRRFAVPV